MDLLKTMQTFVRVANAGSFAAASEQLGVSRANVSKQLQELETHLGARLFNRTTRRLGFTHIGLEYHAFCTRILAEIGEENEVIAHLQREPRGTLKLMAPKSFGNFGLAPAIVDFMARFPDINISMHLSDDSLNTRDLIENGFDLAVRLAPVKESTIVARRIGALQWIICASPAYLAKRGAPRTPNELSAHNCLVHMKSAPDGIWRFIGPGKEKRIKVGGSLSMNSAPGLRTAVLRGLGIALLPAYCIVDDLRKGRLVEVLPSYQVPERPMFIVYPHRRQLPTKVRVFIDFMVERFGRSSWELPAQKLRARPKHASAVAMTEIANSVSHDA